MVLEKVRSWDMQDAEEGLSRCVYKARIYVPDGKMEIEAQSATS